MSTGFGHVTEILCYPPAFWTNSSCHKAKSSTHSEPDTTSQEYNFSEPPNSLLTKCINIALDRIGRLGSITYQTFFNDEWTEIGDMVTNNPDEVLTLVVGMLFPVNGNDGKRITADDIAKVIKFRDAQIFASATGLSVTATFQMLERNKADPMNFHRKWDLKRQIVEKRVEKGLPDEADPELADIKLTLQRDWKQRMPESSSL